MPAIVVVQSLRKAYGKVQALNGISFEIQDGEVFGLLGPNGAGKTTTVECLLGLLEPDEGRIELFGMDVRRYPQEVKERTGAALQSTSLQDRITPREALLVFGAFYRNRAEPSQLLDRFGLSAKADAPFDSLSGGQKQRLALALAFVNNPELVVLDEPTTGLDPQARRELHNEILAMRSEGHTVLLTTHNIDEAQRLCDRIAIVNHGQIVAAGTPGELMNQSASSLALFLVTNPPLGREALAPLPGVRDLCPEAAGLRFTSSNVNRTLAELIKLLDAGQHEIVDLRVQKATLEDVLIELTGSQS